MKRKTLLFLMLMALFAPLAMNGQQTLPVADQGGTTYDSHVPFEGLFSDDNYQHTQTIYPSTMLTAMQGGTITKLTYYLNTAITTNLTSTFEVRLGTTTQTSFSSGTVNYISMTGSANYTGTIDVTNSSKEVTITLTTPYTYNSGNLVVDVRLVNHTSGYKTTEFLGETGSTYYSVYSRDSSSQPPFTQGSSASFMPKTTFTYLSTNPYITLAPTAAAVLTGFNQTLTATYGNVSGTPTITYSSSNTNVATVSGSGTTATVTGVAPGTATITATMNGSYTATCAITVEDPSYCTPNPTSVDGKGITSLTFGSGDFVVNNSNSNGLPASSPYYGDYTSMVGSSEAGETVTVSITYSTGSSTVYSYGTIIWVDWNKNYEFEDSEIVYTGTSAQGTGGTPQVLTATFTVPATQTADDYRMRIAGADSYFDTYIGGNTSANHSPCFSSTYAVCHDYTLRVASASNCPVPTNLTATNLTPSSATLNWDGEAEGYNVRYKIATSGTPAFSDDFENGLSNWTTVDADGDGFNWASHINTGSGNHTTHSGDGVAYSESYDNNGGTALTPDNWLITPQVQLGGSVSFWAMGQDPNYATEHFAIYVSTTGNNPSNFTPISQEYIATSEYVQYSASLSNYSGMGYVAIRHFNISDQFLLNIDDFEIFGPNEWITVNNVNGNSLDITGLSSATTYEFQVQANCGTDGISGWSDSETFTTPDGCAVPTGLTAEVMGIAANLSWTGVQENYNVKYGKVVYFEDFEGGSIPTGWTTINNDGDSYDWYYDNQNSIGHSGTGVMSSASSVNPGSGWVDFEPDNWLVSPQLDLQGTLSVWVRSQNAQEEFYQEHFAIYISTTGTNASDFSVIVPESVTTTEYVEYTADLSSYEGQQGYIAIRHFNCNGQFRMNIDDFGIYDDIHTVTATTVPFTINNLKPSSNYMWQVQGVDCDGNGGTTDWSASASFTTGIAPYEITASADPTEGGTVEFLAGTDAGATTNTHLPTDSYFKYGLTQEIYTPAEIGGGTINSIAFYCETTSNVSFTRTYDIYMVHTDKTVFANGNDWIPVTNSDRVFTGTVTYTPGEWTTIMLDTPFDYNGISNLAIIIDDNTGGFTQGNYLKCRVFTPSIDGFCSMNVHRDGQDPYDPTSPSQYTAGTNSNFDDGMMKVKNLIKVNGSITRTFPEGATCTLVATPNTDYRFVDWTEDDEQVSTSETYSFTVTGDRNLAANFEPNSHTVTIVPNNTDYGSVSQGTVVNVPHGATITTSGNTLTVNETTVTANPAQATGQYTYAFSDWSNVPATVTENVTITANFTQTVNSYTVTIEPNDATYGSVSPGSVTSVPYGTTITTSDNTLTVGSTTVTATPQASTSQYTYAFSSWSNVTETVTGNVTITANFTQTTNSYTLTLIADPTAGGTVSGDGTYNYGEEVTITATANDGYTFGSWSDNGAQSHTVTITGDATYTATFTQNEYTLTLTADPTEGGMLSASPTGPYHYNDVVEVTATPNDGFNFGSWSDGGEQTHTVTITGNTSLTAYFGADHTLTTYVNPIEGGYVTIAPVSNIGCDTIGTTYTSATAVGATTTPFSTQQNYSYQQCLYLASEIASAGWITSISYEVFGNQQAQNDHIEVFMKNTTRTNAFGTGVSSLEPITASDKVFDGTWNIPANGWATIVLDRPFYYDGTSSLVIGIHENSPGYTATSFVKTDCPSNYRFTCYSMTDDMDPLNLNGSSFSTGRGKDRANVRLGFGTYHYGQSITLTAHANEGYQFVNWTENDIELGTNDTYTVSMTDDLDHTIYANFERIIKRFVTDGDWNVANNWWPAGAPDITEDVYIEAAATIPSGCVATANEINITTGSITIADGGQLQHNNDGVSLTAQKEITGYTEPNAETNWNYYLFSSPVTANATYSGIETTPHYDLYSFDASADPLEWIESTTSDLAPYTGFIYASRTNTTINVTGTVPPSNTTPTYTLDYTSGRFIGWNLIGNPFVCNAYVTNNNSANIDYYVLKHQSNYDEFMTASSSDPVAPLSALMVQATAANQSVTYSRTAPSKGAGILNIDVNRTMDRSTTLLDRARVRFGEGEGLQKFQFNPNHTKVYIPEGDKDFAVYYADGAGTIPVNFKAEDNGRYTLDFSTEEIGFNYLHLIDNRNGNDVDLLQTPYYAFDAKSTDFASRFTLVFATGNDNDGNFAFFNNGVWIINNDGKAELQVVDALGRILSSETISGSCSKAINAAPGVYMLRLINGNDVKVQKVVVRR